MDYHGLLYRAVDPRHWGEPLSGAGAAEVAQRFNRKGKEALYTAQRPETVLREKQQEGVLQPLLIVAIRARIENLFDARPPEAIARFGLQEKDIARDDWRDEAERSGLSQSQRLAEAVQAEGHVGMVVPSYAKGATEEDVNIVLWHWGESGRAVLSLVDDDKCLAGLARQGRGP